MYSRPNHIKFKKESDYVILETSLFIQQLKLKLYSWNHYDRWHQEHNGAFYSDADKIIIIQEEWKRANAQARDRESMYVVCTQYK